MRDSGTYERVAAVLTSKVPGTYFTNSDIDEILDACQEAAKQVRGSGQEQTIRDVALLLGVSEDAVARVAGQEAAKQVRGSGQERKCCFEWKETGLTCEDCPGVPELDQKMGYK